MNSIDIAQNAANIEVNFGDQFKEDREKADVFISNDRSEYKILSRYSYTDENVKDVPKAMILQDKAGNIYVHFNGTIDGTWKQNSVAYGGDSSNLQQSCLDWFNDAMKNIAPEAGANVYVTGHSQGANVAMYVTMRCDKAIYDKINYCVELDGEGFSHEFVNNTKNSLGLEEYCDRINKIYAVNGENDYVSTLGLESIVPDDPDHNKFVENFIKENEFEDYHHARGLINENGEMIECNGSSEFRQIVSELTAKIANELPKDQLDEVIEVVMLMIENDEKEGSNGYKEKIDATKFEHAKEYLIPILLDYLKEEPSKLVKLLELKFTPEEAEALSDILGYLNSYPDYIKIPILEGMLSCISLDEEGYRIDIDFSNIPIQTILDMLPILAGEVANNSKDIVVLLKELGVYDDLIDWCRKHPLEAAGVFALLGVFGPGVFHGLLLEDVCLRVIQVLVDEGVQFAGYALDFFGYAKSRIDKLRAKLDKKFAYFYTYTQEHLYIRADTEKLLFYADWLRNINRRLEILDQEMRTLYGQVRLRDLGTILHENMMTRKSGRLEQAAKYLIATSEILTDADNKIKSCFGG